MACYRPPPTAPGHSQAGGALHRPFHCGGAGDDRDLATAAAGLDEDPPGVTQLLAETGGGLAPLAGSCAAGAQ